MASRPKLVIQLGSFDNVSAKGLKKGV